MGTVFTYARVSTLDQNVDIQKVDLQKAYPKGVFRQEKMSGTEMYNRDVLNLILDMIDEGDKLVVWKLDRLARNMHDLTRITKLLDKKKADLEILNQKIDTSTASGNAFLQMLGVFAEFENNLRKERQMAGIALARKKGIHLGRKPVLNSTEKWEIYLKYCNNVNPSRLAREYSVSRATIYNAIKEMQNQNEKTLVNRKNQN